MPAFRDGITHEHNAVLILITALFEKGATLNILGSESSFQEEVRPLAWKTPIRRPEAINTRCQPLALEQALARESQASGWFGSQQTEGRVKRGKIFSFMKTGARRDNWRNSTLPLKLVSATPDPK